MIIKIAVNGNGSHDNMLTNKIAPEGWIVVPPELEAKARALLPFINLHIENGMLVDVSAGERIVSDEEAAAELTAAKAARIAQSKADLEAYLAAHPLLWTDGQSYAITAEKQRQLTSKLMSASMAQSMQVPYTLTWNSTGEVCREWTLTDLTALAFAIDERVTALVTYQQTQEVAMKTASTMEELGAVEVDYDAVQ